MLIMYLAIFHAQIWHIFEWEMCQGSLRSGVEGEQIRKSGYGLLAFDTKVTISLYCAAPNDKYP